MKDCAFWFSFFHLYIVIEYTGTLRRRAVSCLNTGSILELAGA